MRSTFLLALALSACTSIVPLTAMRLSGLSPITADPADFAIDLTLPAGIELPEGSAKLIFSVTRDDFGQTEEGRLTLLRDGSVFAVDPVDYTKLRALQALARQWQAENEDATSGSILIELSSPCRVGEGPADDAKVSVAIQMAQGGPFLPLVRNGPLSAVTSEEQLRDMPDCP